MYGSGSGKNLAKIQKVIIDQLCRSCRLRQKEVQPFCRRSEGAGMARCRGSIQISYACITHKIIKYHTPVSLSSFIQANRDTRVRSTRQGDDLRLPPVRTEAGRRRFLYYGPMLYNQLPAEMRSVRCQSVVLIMLSGK